MVPIVLYNSLGQEREYVAKATVNTNHITLKNSLKEDVRLSFYQKGKILIGFIVFRCLSRSTSHLTQS
jgi:hypothetical protein